MKKAKIAEAKNNFSSLIEAVKRGESILILDRDTPVARLEPVGGSVAGKSERLADMVRRGVVSPPRQVLDVSVFLGRKMARVVGKASAVRVLIDERREGQ
jgi:prevent-host-death family protein